jgi:RND family efflux transporter MFP subunit
MAEIEAPDVDAQLRQMEASLAQARANLEIARLTFGRQKYLLDTKVISHQEYDIARTTMDAQDAAVKAGEANVQNLQVLQGFQKITAPFAGVVTRRNTDVGALINAGSNATGASAQELFHAARTDILRVYVYVPQNYSPEVKLNAPAYLDLAEFPGVKFQGKISHIAGAIDPASRTLLTEVQVPNGDGRLYPGAFANVHLILHFQNAPTVLPGNTLLFRAQGTQVAAVDRDGTVRLKNVVLGRDFGTSLEVVSGVTSHDRIIVNPSDSVAEGARVQVQASDPL